ncbi:MAG TPA: hypothetical protein VH684_05630 [Xanthobacteraceae bacterium]
MLPQRGGVRAKAALWRFVFVKDETAKEAQSFLDFPPMQKGASFNLEALKEEMEKKIASQAAQ